MPRLLLMIVLATALPAADIRLTDGRVLHNARIIEIDGKIAIIKHAEGIEGVPLALVPREFRVVTRPPEARAGNSREAKKHKAPSEAEIEAAALDLNLTLVEIMPLGVLATAEGVNAVRRKERVRFPGVIFVRMDSRQHLQGTTITRRVWPVGDNWYVDSAGVVRHAPRYSTNPADFAR